MEIQSPQAQWFTSHLTPTNSPPNPPEEPASPSTVPITSLLLSQLKRPFFFGPNYFDWLSLSPNHKERHFFLPSLPGRRREKNGVGKSRILFSGRQGRELHGHARINSYTDNHVKLGILSLFLQVRRWNLRGVKKIAQMGETELFTAPFCLSKRGCAIQTPCLYLK